MVKFIGQEKIESKQRNILNERLVPEFSKLLKPKSKLIIVGSGINWEYQEDFKQCDITKTEKNFDIPDTMYDDICNSKIGQEFVDAVLFNGMWEVVDDPFRAMWNVYLMLKKGGYILFGAPYKMRLGNKDYWRITPLGVTKILEDFDFTIVKQVEVEEDYIYAIAQKNGQNTSKK